VTSNWTQRIRRSESKLIILVGRDSTALNANRISLVTIMGKSASGDIWIPANSRPFWLPVFRKWTVPSTAFGP
jgi:hypothetical protein